MSKFSSFASYRPQSGPLRCAALALDGQSGLDDRQIVERVVTIGRMHY